MCAPARPSGEKVAALCAIQLLVPAGLEAKDEVVLLLEDYDGRVRATAVKTLADLKGKKVVVVRHL